MRNSVRNFLKAHSDGSINQLPIQVALGLEEKDSIEDYIKNILMKEDEDPSGIVLNLTSIVLRINIDLIVINKKNESIASSNTPKFTIQEMKAKYDDMYLLG